MPITTGAYVNSVSGTNATPPSARTMAEIGGSKSRVLFQPGAPGTVSAAFCLTPKQVAFVSAFGLPSGAQIAVSRVVLRPGEVPSGTPCGCKNCLPAPGPQQIAYSKPEMCGDAQIKLTSTNSDLVIPGPGCFQLTLSPASAGSDLYVEMTLDTQP